MEVNSTLYSTSVKINGKILLAVLPIVVILTLLGNGAYIITLIKKRALHLPSNILLGSLAVSDILIAIVAEPVWIAKISSIINGYYSKTLEKVTNGTMFIFLLISVLNIMAVSIDRYIAIFHPFWYHAKATCTTHLIVAIGVLAASIVLYILLIPINMIHKSLPRLAYISFICISLVIVSYCNLKIFSLIRNQTRQINEVSDSPNEEADGNVAARETQEMSKAAIIVVITILFFTLYMPFIVKVSIKMWVTEKDRNKATLVDFWVLFPILLNSCVNPIVYYIRMKRFREAAKEVFCGRSTLANM